MKTVDSLLSRFVSAVDDRYPVELTYPKKGYLLTQISKFRRGMSEVTKGIIRSLSAISMLLFSLSGCPPPFCFWMIPLFPPIADGLLPHDGDHGWILLPPPREGGKLFVSRSVGNSQGRTLMGPAGLRCPPLECDQDGDDWFNHAQASAGSVIKRWGWPLQKLLSAGQPTPNLPITDPYIQKHTCSYICNCSPQISGSW